MKCLDARCGISWLGLILGLLMASIVWPSRADANPWDDATNAATKERFIPVELWTGGEWNGRRELETPKIEGNYRHNNSAYSIKGPTE